jgi:DNA helicase II / ATP-dependent DNA helicase PcrA
MSELLQDSPALAAAKQAEAEVRACLDAGQSFLLEAGAGAGKTFSLVGALRHLIDCHGATLKARDQRVACITYTNAATAVINSRIDGNKLVFTDTIHAFCWSLIKSYQSRLRAWIKDAPIWQERIVNGPAFNQQVVEYDLGYRRIDETLISLHHDDVLAITTALLALPKFQTILAERYPYILVDEYQDTNADVMAAVCTHLLGRTGGPLIGLFGDHWQRIYDKTCGHVKHNALREIGKKANFRSATSIVDALNQMRPALPQAPDDETVVGEARVFHTNAFAGARRPSERGGHWKGDLPTDAAHEHLRALMADLQGQGWDLSAKATKILMLTHNVLAQEQGYRALADVFSGQTDLFIKKEDDYIGFFADRLEPACHAYAGHKFGLMFEALGAAGPKIQSHAQKSRWSAFMDKLAATRTSGTVADVLEVIREADLIRLPEGVEKREHLADTFVAKEGEEVPTRVRSARALRAVPYREVLALVGFINGHTPFATKHSVKGDEFENVLVVLGRGWNRYNFDQFLQWEAQGGPPDDNKEAFERNRNLFYVACSRPTTRLALLFTQKLEDDSLKLLQKWFGAPNVFSFQPGTAA